MLGSFFCVGEGENGHINHWMGWCVAVQKQVETAADIVSDLMEDINRKLFVASAVADITRTYHPHVL